MHHSAGIVRYLRSNYQVILLSFLVACNSIPSYPLTFMPGIDGPLPWVFNYFADGHFERAGHLLFPHGPLAFLMYPLAMGNNLYVTVAITFLSSFVLALHLFTLRPAFTDLVVAFICILLFQTFFEIQHLLFAVSVSCVLLYERRQTAGYLVAAVAFAMLNLYIKSYGGVISLLMLLSFMAHSLYRKNYRALVYIIASFIFLHLISWLLLFGTADGSFDFLMGQVELSAGNSDAVSYFQVNDWLYISISLIALILIPFVTRDTSTRFLMMLFLLPLFAAWKHAMSRGDGAHVNGFLAFLILMAFFLAFTAMQNRVRVFILACLSVGAFITNMGRTALYNDFEEEKRIAAIRTFNLYKYLVHHDSIRDFKARGIDEINRTAVLPDHLRKMIGKRTVDIFPWNYSVIAMNDLHWMPRPTLHTYAMYSAWLDGKNAEHLASEQSAELILWEIRELGGGYLSIDNRYLLNDGPRVADTLMSRYKLIYKDEKYFLYQRQKDGHTLNKKIITKAEDHSFFEWIDVPAAGMTTLLKARIDIRKNLPGALKSAFFKGEGFHVSMELEDGRTVDHKIIPATAREGIWMNPLIKFPGTALPEPAVKRFYVFCTDTAFVNETFTVQFEKADFKDGYNFLKDFFGKEKADSSLPAQ